MSGTCTHTRDYNECMREYNALVGARRHADMIFLYKNIDYFLRTEILIYNIMILFISMIIYIRISYYLYYNILKIMMYSRYN